METTVINLALISLIMGGYFGFSYKFSTQLGVLLSDLMTEFYLKWKHLNNTANQFLLRKFCRQECPLNLIVMSIDDIN